MNFSRRDMLKLSAGGAALWATGIDPLRAADDGAKKKVPIALQLYSVRNNYGKDPAGTLEAVAKMGYRGVEFAGYVLGAKELRKLLDQNGLKCCGTHIGLNVLVGDALKKTVEFNKTIGNPFLIVASMHVPKTKDEVLKVAKQFTDIAEKIKPEGMRVGYHAHGGDFKKIDGETFWDIFYTNAGPDVTMQLDIGNCIGGGGDPYAVLKKFPGRSATIHLKEHGGKSDAAVGDGTVKWDEVFKLCETTGKTEWYIVEHESGNKPMESVKKCLENLKKMGK
jgi:sugar phosphate isomerase/epimerase